jgi:myosin tail region-interacting protein MTI1
MAMSPNAGSDSDDEMSLHAPKLAVDTHPSETAQRAVPPRPTGPLVPSRPSEGLSSPRSPTSKRASHFNNEPSPGSPTTPGATNKRTSRVPPIPVSSPPVSSTQSRAPPPPPPGASLSRSSTGDSRVLQSPKHPEEDESDEEITEYEGDYDTDIASAAPHKDALSHATESSLDDNTPVRSAVGSPSGVPPPLPPMTTHRAVPPLPPSQPPPNSRPSTDMPRAAPPPPPPKEQSYADDDDEYDPYRYTASILSRPAATVPSPPTNDDDEEDLYTASPQRTQVPRPPQERPAPPPPPREQAPPPTREFIPPASSRPAPRQSTDVQRTQAASRRSTDLNRISMDSGFVANDVDLGQGSLWWTQQNSTPPVFQGRKDILYETEESTSTKRGGKSTATRDLYVLFQDYSQTVITVRYDPTNPADASLEQRHEPPPSRLRQDQLEASYERFGRRISEAVATKKDTVVSDGTPQALVTELLKPFPDALLPVGTRAYGALVYGNLANASTTQNDEIRPGDIITLRNAKFQGKHGPMHAKYSMEVGGSGVGHVGVVAEWDGTKKKVRAWEQGREKKKVGLESYKLDDLRSGEVKIWRIMDRNWVGWEGTN